MYLVYLNMFDMKPGLFILSKDVLWLQDFDCQSTVFNIIFSLYL